MKKFINEYGSLESAVMKSEDLFDTARNLFPIELDMSNPESVDRELPSSDKFPRTQLLLSGWELVEENYPLPIKGNNFFTYILLTIDS